MSEERTLLLLERRTSELRIKLVEEAKAHREAVVADERAFRENSRPSHETHAASLRATVDKRIAELAQSSARVIGGADDYATLPLDD